MAYKNPLRYFYLDGQLHRWIKADRPRDEMIAWKYSEGKTVYYSYASFKKNAKKAYTRADVGKILNRHPVTINKYINKGWIARPQFHYIPGSKKRDKYLFSEEDIYGIHDFLLDSHSHEIKPTPSRAELRAMLNHDIVTYVKNKDGEFIPVWKERDW